MLTKDHYILGCYLINNFHWQMTPLSRHLFLLGCIEPDMNPFTYARGSIRHHFMHGHNADNVKNHLEHIINRLKNTGVATPFQWFELGAALHYTADCFTFPHNEIFTGTLKEHCKYESLFHPIFENYLSECACKILQDVLIEDLEDYHASYLSDNHSYLTDCNYIRNAVICLCRQLDFYTVGSLLLETK